jgi:hypothetical protein
VRSECDQVATLSPPLAGVPINVTAVAVDGHGIPRATGDIDLWVRPTADNVARPRALG